ncbi:CDP-alcohol phosphatidyltransferase family protein, partial [Candidatus Micrarchaeota archaeon]|nr:CDP-alcohol phosphatidyltransferase family protein [Candidatus Micrarchaeota archaeon]
MVFGQLGILKFKDLFTLASAICALLAVFFAPISLFYSLLLIAASAFFDKLDGYAARALKQSNEFGKQLDSLVDAIAFGAAPAMIVWLTAPNLLGANIHVLIASLFYVFCILVRLANFNLQKQKGFFIGLPSPIGAVLAVAW